jgi:hypothetical protein
MAHLNQSFLTASGALATRGMRSFLDVSNPVSSEATQNQSNARQRRLSRPNNVEELRRKRRRRNKKIKEKKHSLQKCEAKTPGGQAKGSNNG